jgi:hypothetical protein
LKDDEEAAPSVDETTCRRCGETIRYINGHWTDCETHTSCDQPDLDVADIPKHKPAIVGDGANLDGDALSALTAIVREADQLFQNVDGASRHWVRECFWPILQREGWRLEFRAAPVVAEAFQRDRSHVYVPDVYQGAPCKVCRLEPHHHFHRMAAPKAPAPQTEDVTALLDEWAEETCKHGNWTNGHSLAARMAKLLRAPSGPSRSPHTEEHRKGNYIHKCEKGD